MLGIFGGKKIVTTQYKSKGFTLAETLITLAIIGVVSALVIPTVIKNYNDKKYNTARLKALKTFGEAGKMASINDEMNTQTNATDFVNKVLSKYLKITKVCDTAAECNFPSQIQPLNTDADKISSDSLTTWKSLGIYNNTRNLWTSIYANSSIYIMTSDGFSAKMFYNPKCVKNTHENPYNAGCLEKECGTMFVDDTCINVIYDMNGLKGPNNVGHDIGFVTVFWSGLNTASAAPGLIPYDRNRALFNTGTQAYRDTLLMCSQMIINKVPSNLPSVDELSSMYLNQKLSSLPESVFWSGSAVANSADKVWVVYHERNRQPVSINGWNYSRPWCVRR